MVRIFTNQTLVTLNQHAENEDFSYLKSTMESSEFVEAIKSGFPWSVVERERCIMGLKMKELYQNSIEKTLRATKN